MNHDYELEQAEEQVPYDDPRWDRPQGTWELGPWLPPGARLIPPTGRHCPAQRPPALDRRFYQASRRRPL